MEPRFSNDLGLEKNSCRYLLCGDNVLLRRTYETLWNGGPQAPGWRRKAFERRLSETWRFLTAGVIWVNLLLIRARSIRQIIALRGRPSSGRTCRPFC